MQQNGSPRAGSGTRTGLSNAPAQEYLDPTYPVPRPPPAAYVPPAGCPAPWFLVVLSFSIAIAGDQYDRVAAVWLDGAELLRTTTAEPTPDGVRWTVRKDVTRYSGLLRSPPGGVLSVMLENLVNDLYTGVYNISVSLEFHGAPAYLVDAGSSTAAGSTDPGQATPKLPASYFQPADLILPISEGTGNISGFWFRIQNSSDSRSKLVSIPSNTYRTVLEVFVSPHSNDEFWYSNPPGLYIRENNLTTGRGNAAYREVVVSVDRHFAGSFVPFPVIYTGGINPLFWQPVVALGAFDLPTYDVELTPFLGLLVDGKAHEIVLSVVDGIAEWLVDANLHLWLDPASSNVSAALSRYTTPRLSISRRYYTRRPLDGRFEIRAKRKSRFSGWVNSSFGNFTTDVETELEATSLVEFTSQGRNKTTRKEVGKVETEAKYPLWLEMVTEDGENGTYVMRANLMHSLSVETDAEAEGLFDGETKVVDEQAAVGWMLVRDHDVLDGSAATTQAYRTKTQIEVNEDKEHEASSISFVRIQIKQVSPFTTKLDNANSIDVQRKYDEWVVDYRYYNLQNLEKDLAIRAKWGSNQHPVISEFDMSKGGERKIVDVKDLSVAFSERLIDKKMFLYVDVEEKPVKLVATSVVSEATEILSNVVNDNNSAPVQSSFEPAAEHGIDWDNLEIIPLIEDQIGSAVPLMSEDAMEWQVSGKPYPHALALITTCRNPKMQDYMHPYYSVYHFRIAYGGVIKPLPDKTQWAKVNLGFRVLPPLSKLPVGRLRKLRIPGCMEDKGNKKRTKGKWRVQCKTCFAYGHRTGSPKCPLTRTKKRKSRAKQGRPCNPVASSKGDATTGTPKRQKVDAQESSTPMPVTRSQLQLTMENMRETSHVNINPGPITRSQIGGATDPMTTPTRPKKSPTKRAINKKLTPRKGKMMDNLDRICIRFHFGGTFTTVGGALFYVGGDIAESWIDVDRLSFFEIKGHLTDHYNPSVLRLYWLKPGMHINNGLVLLLDDDSCQVMASYHSDGSCVDMYVEEVAMEINADDQDIWLGDDEGGDEANDQDMPADVMQSSLMDDKDYQSYMAFYKSPSKDSDKGKRAAVTEDEEDCVQMSSDDTCDEEYKQPSEEDSSADDEEAIELRNYARQIKRNIRAKKLGFGCLQVHGGGAAARKEGVAGGSSPSMGLAWEGAGPMTGDAVLDGLMEVFPQVDFSTLIEVSIQFKDDIDAAADYIVQNVVPNIVQEPSHPNINEDLNIHGNQQAFDNTNTHLGLDSFDNKTSSNSVQFDLSNKTSVEQEDILTGLCPKVFDVPSTSGQNCTSEESSSGSLMQHTYSERNPELSSSGGHMSLHDDASSHVTVQSSNFLNLESLDNIIANEHYKKNALMSNVVAISEMLQVVELNEENTKRAISEASQAGNDLLVKVEELKEMTTLAVEENNKVEGEILAEKSFLAAEAQELQCLLSNISEETKSFVLAIDKMQDTLQRRLVAAEAERAAAEKAKLEREASAQKSLDEQEFLLEAAKNKSKRLEQEAQENAKLRELLTERGHVVDALHGEMLGIFDSITKLKLRVDIQIPVDEEWQHISLRLSKSNLAVEEPVQQVPFVSASSALDEQLQQTPLISSRSTVDETVQQIPPVLSCSASDEQLQVISPILSSSTFDEPQQLVSPRLSSLVRSARSDSSLAESLASKSNWLSAVESRIDDVSYTSFGLDDSWDVVDDDDETMESPASIPMLL
ncbi:unnamed protein product [Miscanthus lutarioriparius]|uniref:CUE domain-containing protein n=1 Tax=Miscanthus lutarioriparius TaxID=422564 RepID=A0A811RXT2_9POAL|nr:unnamed protein product [Miscanthus lutarioriparius]